MKLSFIFIEILLIPIQTFLYAYVVPVRLLILSILNDFGRLIYKRKATLETFIFIISIIYTIFVIDNFRDMIRVILCFSTFYFAMRFQLPKHNYSNIYLLIILVLITLEKLTLELGFLFNSRDPSGALFLFGEKSYASQIIFLLAVLFGDWEKRTYQTTIITMAILIFFGGGLSHLYIIIIILSFIIKLNKYSLNFILIITVITGTYFSKDLIAMLTGLVAAGVIDYSDALRPLLNILCFQESKIFGHGSIYIYEHFKLADEINRPWNRDWTSVSGQAILPILSYSTGWLGVVFIISLVLRIQSDVKSQRNYLLYIMLMLNLMLQSQLVSVVNFIIIAFLTKNTKVNSL